MGTRVIRKSLLWASTILSVVSCQWSLSQLSVLRAQPWDAEVSLADFHYEQGMALARLARLEEAREAFLTGQALAPADVRFPLELAGICFRQKELALARSHLKQALDLDPDNSYARDFLGTLHLLRGNLEAALEHWNSIGKPEINGIRIDPRPRVDPVLLDRAFSFSPAGILHLKDLQETNARLELLRIFPRYKFELQPRPQGNFDLLLRPVEKNGLGEGSAGKLLSIFRGLPFQTLHLDYFNIRQSAANWISSFRWDPEKLRVFLSFSSPLPLQPRWRYAFDLDARNENWDGSRSLASGLDADLKLQKLEARAGLTLILNGQWSWSSEIRLSQREFTTTASNRSEFPLLFQTGPSLHYGNRLDHEISRPEIHLGLVSFAEAEIGKIFSDQNVRFFRIEGGTRTRWLIWPQAEDLEFQSGFRAGKILGAVPFDLLYSLGLERDNDIFLRGHRGTHQGRKGSGPLGSAYILINSEIDKNILHSGLFRLRAGPFLDIGRSFDRAHRFQFQQWMYDLGGQLKIDILGGIGLIISYGRDLRSGGSVFYARLSP
ncbi:MAG: tetratricopeptide repeat protein [Acidobacteriota bacterium]